MININCYPNFINYGQPMTNTILLVPIKDTIDSGSSIKKYRSIPDFACTVQKMGAQIDPNFYTSTPYSKKLHATFYYGTIFHQLFRHANFKP